MKPCKYGPRDASGYCPKKPATSRPKLPPADNFLDKPRDQGFTPAGNRRAPTTIRKEASKVVEAGAKAVTTEVVKRAVEAYKKDPNQVKGALAEVAKGLGKIGIAVTIAKGIFELFQYGDRVRADQIERQVFEMINDVKRVLVPRGQWKSEYVSSLAPQYRQFLRQNLEILFRK